jgi:uncharacterized protein YdaU (DUF1376 family)
MSDAWFAFYVGDYIRDTGDLSLNQHGAFVKLLFFYYSTGNPLPSDQRALYRIAGAQDEGERAAVDSVMSRFFVLRDGVYHQDRADRELAKRNVLHERLSDAGKKRWHKPGSSLAYSQAASPAIASPQPQPQPHKDNTSRASHDGVCEELVVFWNGNSGVLPEVQKLTKERRAKVATRIKTDPQFPDRFKRAILKAKETPFCTGAGERGWKATFDWFITNDTNCVAVLEGKYDTLPNNGSVKEKPVPIAPRRRSENFRGDDARPPLLPPMTPLPCK